MLYGFKWNAGCREHPKAESDMRSRHSISAPWSSTVPSPKIDGTFIQVPVLLYSWKIEQALSHLDAKKCGGDRKPKSWQLTRPLASLPDSRGESCIGRDPPFTNARPGASL